MTRCQNLIECSLGQQVHLRSCKRAPASGSIFCNLCEASIDRILAQDYPVPAQSVTLARKPAISASLKRQRVS